MFTALLKGPAKIGGVTHRAGAVVKVDTATAAELQALGLVETTEHGAGLVFGDAGLVVGDDGALGALPAAGDIDELVATRAAALAESMIEAVVAETFEQLNAENADLKARLAETEAQRFLLQDRVTELQAVLKEQTDDAAQDGVGEEPAPAAKKPGKGAAAAKG